MEIKESTIINSSEVFAWPEFRILVERLGFVLGEEVTEFTLTLSLNQPARVSQETMLRNKRTA